MCSSLNYEQTIRALQHKAFCHTENIYQSFWKNSTCRNTGSGSEVASARKRDLA